ncbi:MAG: S8 family serine peptidase, partial [Bacteroidia bacterium]|nr:S8 family serine peptidase [Bacteroidia bacterium]
DFCGRNPFDPQPDNEPKPEAPYSWGAIDHGTQVASLSSATTDNGLMIAGVAFRCKFLPIKIYGEEVENVSYGAYDAIVYAADHGVKVINCSFGTQFYSQLGQDAVNYATFNRNVLVVAAAGNSGDETRYYPAAFDNVIAVAATTENDTRAGNSTFGYHIDVCAPGSSRSLIFDNNTLDLSGYATSYSSPIAAGVAALIRSQNPLLSAVQAGEQLRVSASNIYSINPTLPGKLGSGRVNMLQALTTQLPSVRLVDNTFTDGNNNIVEPGDTVRLVSRFRNYLESVPLVNVQLATLNTNVITVLDGVTSLNNMTTNAIRSNSLDPFLMVVNPNALPNTNVVFKFTYSALGTSGAYQAEEYFVLTVQPTYVDLIGANAASTTNSNGNFGYNDFPNNILGKGFQYAGSVSLLREGGFLVGRSASQMANNIRINNVKQDSAFVALQPVKLQNPGPVSAMQADSRFNDWGLGPDRMNVLVKQTAFAFNTGDENKSILFRYVIYNQNLFVLDNMHFGWYADFNTGPNASENKGIFDASERLIYTESKTPNFPVVGMKLIAPDSGYTIHAYSNDVRNFEFNSRAEKFRIISSGTDSATTNPTQDLDVFQTISVGPVRILPGDSFVVAFALVGGNNPNQLRQVANAAEIRYNCIYFGSPLVIQLPTSVSACGSTVLDAETFGAASYAW